MASAFVGKLLFSSALFLFLLAFIFAIVGYETYWLVPRDDYGDGNRGRVDGVGLKIVCFSNDFQFIRSHDRDTEKLNGCYDNTRDSAKFTSINPDVWSPRWFQTVQDMHIACIIIMVLNMLLFGGFLSMYFFASYLKRKGKMLSPCLIVTEYGLALWFILTFILGIMLLVEPIIFYANHQSESQTFYYSENHHYNYGPGFALTVTAGVCLLVSGGLGAALFCGMVMRFVKTNMNQEGQDYYTPSGSQYSGSEGDRLSMAEEKVERQSRKDPDGHIEPEEMETYQDEPPVRADRRSTTSLSRDMPDEKGDRPKPAPRRSGSSRDTSREPSVAKDPSTYTDGSRAPSVYSGSQAPSVRSARPAQFQYDLKPGYGYVPKPARAASDVDSQYSATPQRAGLSPHTPVAGGRLYVPPSRTSYAGSTAGHSDTDSQADRNRSVSRSSVSPRADAPPPATTPQKVIKPKDTTDAKHSRYAASGW